MHLDTATRLIPARKHRPRFLFRDDRRLAYGRRKNPSDFDYNVKVTSSVVEYAHKYGVTVEGEIGASAASKTE